MFGHFGNNPVFFLLLFPEKVPFKLPAIFSCCWYQIASAFFKKGQFNFLLLAPDEEILKEMENGKHMTCEIYQHFKSSFTICTCG